MNGTMNPHVTGIKSERAFTKTIHQQKKLSPNCSLFGSPLLNFNQ